MAYLRKVCNEGIRFDILYSIFQKCMRRGLSEQCLYYGLILKNEGSYNVLKKRLVQVVIEDICRLDLALEIFNYKENDIEKYIGIVCENKKTHLSDWFQQKCLMMCIKNNNITNKDLYENINEKMIKKGMEITKLEKLEKYKEIRKYFNKDENKLYTYMNKSRLVWSCKILCKLPELNYELKKDLDIIPKKFDVIPYYVYDKHTGNSKNKSLTFFLEHGLFMNNKIYEKEEPYEKEVKEFLLEEEKKYGKLHKTKQILERWKYEE